MVFQDEKSCFYLLRKTYIPKQKRTSHELVLLDRMLPSLDGLQILRIIWQENIATPVLLVTALGDLNERNDGLETGADDYIIKPFAFRELLARIRFVCRRPQQLSSDFLITYGDIEYNFEEKTLSSFNNFNTIATKIKRI